LWTPSTRGSAPNSPPPQARAEDRRSGQLAAGDLVAAGAGLTLRSRREISPKALAVPAADANGPVHGSPLRVPASAVEPGDYLPPQRCLDPTAWQDSGFRIGARQEDVCRDHPLAAGHVLLFGPLGVLDFLTNRDVVSVVRPYRP
jgi:hypothetical protein